MSSNLISLAASAISKANFLIIAAGAGMGVDSGLPDFRGEEGFWNAYPPIKKLGLTFPEVATPRWFEEDPEFAWGFYGHRYHLYKETQPNAGFQILLNLASNMKHGYAVCTSNVDGHFQKAGFSEQNVYECHGSISYLQCSDDCSGKIWPANNLQIDVDMNTFRARGDLPRCPDCGKICRPNILMFNDWAWNSARSEDQSSRFDHICTHARSADASIVIVEIGAGESVPTVRNFSNSALYQHSRTVLIRINPDSPFAHRSKSISLSMSGLEALQEISKTLSNQPSKSES